MRASYLLCLFATAAASPLLAQQVVDSDQSVETIAEKREIIVTAPKPKGSVIGNIPPDIEINEEEIKTYGAASLADLITSVAPVSGSSRGRGGGMPVVLINGQRVSGFGEIRSIPPEAIQRFQVLPEEAAIAYGYRPEQRVINIILKPGFQSTSVDARLRVPTAGGRSEARIGTGLFRNSDIGRLTVDFDYAHDSRLLESERDIAAGSPDERNYRTLLPEADEINFNAALSRKLSDRVSGTFNVKAGFKRDLNGFGLSDLDPSDALTGSSRNATGHVGLALNGAFTPWNWSVTANYDHSDSRTRTDSGLASPTVYRTSSVSDTAAADAVLTGPLLTLPAGRVQSTFKLGGSTVAVDSSAIRSGPAQKVNLSRGELRAQTSLVLPLTSRRENVLAAVGDISINLDAGVTRLSDFGTINTIGYGLTWQPIEPVRLSLSFTDEEGAPGLSQLGNPTTITPNARIYDFRRGETVEVISTAGGNPALRSDNRKSWAATAMLRPTGSPDFTLNFSFNHNDTRDPVMSLSAVSPVLEAAFPERFTRDSSGRLIAIDTRAVNFARETQDELRSSIFFSKTIGKARPTAQRGIQGGAPAGGPGLFAGGAGGRPGGGFAGGGRPGGMGGGGGFAGAPVVPGQARLMLALEHQWRLNDKVLIRDGIDEVDLLDGQSVGGRSGQARHKVTARLNFIKDGIGTELATNWQNGTLLRGTAANGASDLHFSSFLTADLRLFVDFDRKSAPVKASPFLKGARLSLNVDNLLDSHQKVRDGLGDTPLNYRADYLDPLGRTIRLSFRKLF